MAVTAQQIAELAGVSRGTVDRALHNRGRVNPEVAERIRQIAVELGYKPNLVGQAPVSYTHLVAFSLYEIPASEYDHLEECVKTLCLERTKSSVKCLLFRTGVQGEADAIASLSAYQVQLPAASTAELRQQITALDSRMGAIDADVYKRQVEGWARNPDAGDLTVLMNSAALDRLEETLLADLKARMLDGVTLKASDRFDGGFRMAMKDGGIYYDFAAEAVVDMLSNYLSPKVTALLKEAE